jgi:hypothetical protein
MNDHPPDGITHDYADIGEKVTGKKKRGWMSGTKIRGASV